MNKNLYIAIMAGGIGTRFWPKSTQKKPKQFLDILGIGKTLLQQTFERSKKLCPSENIFVITAQNYEQLVHEQIPEIPKENILTEPFRRNTAPCINYIAYKLYLKNPHAILICKPADHIIFDEDKFISVCSEGIAFIAEHNALLTIGIKPHKPHTGYGYIQYKDNNHKTNIYAVRAFMEKPNLEMAQKFLDSGEYLWNAGIFMWKAADIIAAFKKYMKDDFDLFVAHKEEFNTLHEKEAIACIYACIKNISIDYAILEKADNVFVIPASLGWNDVGSWGSVYEMLPKDHANNAGTDKKFMMIESQNNLFNVEDKEKLLVVQGLNNYIIVDTNNVLFICHQDKEQDIKIYLDEIAKKNQNKYL